MIPIYKGRERRRFKDSKFIIWLGGVRSTLCRAKPVALEETTVRGRIVADVVFGDQKHKLASLKTSQSFLTMLPFGDCGF